MQLLAMNSMPTAPQLSGSQATGQATPDQPFGQFLNSWQRTADGSGQPAQGGLAMLANPQGQGLPANAQTKSLESLAKLAGLDLTEWLTGLPQQSDASGEDMLAALQEKLAVQLDRAGLDAEQVLAQLDFSAVAAQLNSLTENPQSADQLTLLMASLQNRLTATLQQFTSAEKVEPADGNRLPEQLSAMLEQTGESALREQLIGLLRQPEADSLASRSSSGLSPEQVAQLKNLLQQEIDGTVKNSRQLTENSSWVAGLAHGRLGMGAEEETLDRRFTGLLAGQKQDSLLQPSQQKLDPQNPQGWSVLHGPPAAQNAQVGLPSPATSAPLTTAQTGPDSQIFDQVVTRLAGSFNGESGRMVLRLHPAELGALRLDLHVEGETIRAHFQAQTTQVQEVLERNLPQLRQALAEQGLKIDQFQVNIDQRQAGQGEQFEKHGQWQSMNNHGASAGADLAEADSSYGEEQVIPLAHLIQNGGSGISLRV